MSKETDQFQSEMAQIGVKPLARRAGKLIVSKPGHDINAASRREAALAMPGHGTDIRSNNPHYHADIKWLGPQDVVEFKRQGIQHEVFKQLKQGQYRAGATLDLHEQRIDEARVNLFRFLEDCHRDEIRCALVIHGKGHHTHPGEGELPSARPVSRIKSYVVHWLKGHELVQAVSSAPRQQGGTGAVYVLLRKSDRAKERNRERFRTDKD